MDSIVLTEWNFHSSGDHITRIYPDGCQDVILRYRKDSPPVWVVTSIDTTSRMVRSVSGEHFAGFRLQPGTIVNMEALIRHIQGYHYSELNVLAIIKSHTVADSDVQDALHYLTRSAMSVAAVARASGVSVRTLQRKLTTALGKPPSFWLALARVRKAARMLSSQRPLVAIAHDCGYSDQAHLHREMQRWYCYTPMQLRNNPEQLAVVTGQGYA